MPTHALAMLLELAREGVPVGRAHGKRDALAREGVFGQSMDLRVAQHLQAVLEAAQIRVRGLQLGDDIRRQQPRARELRQRAQQRGRLQPAVATAADELEGLHDELDLANAAGTELDVIGELAPLDLALDQRFHLPQALEHPVVQIAAIDERPHRGSVNFGVALGRRDRACLDVCVTLPVAAVAWQVILEGGKTGNQRAAVPEGAQSQVDAQHEAVGRRRLQQPYEALAEPREELLVRNRARAVCLAMLGKQQNEVDVRGEVELAASEFAHCNHDERLRRAVSGTGLPIAGDEGATRDAYSSIDRRVRKRAQLGERLLEIGPTRKITPRYAHHLVTPPVPQLQQHLRVRGGRLGR